jgi:putative oxidoreductase
MNTPLLHRGLTLWNNFTAILDSARPLAALAARLYLAQVFFLSGLTKLRDWETTLLLFTEEYRVPLLSPPAAAVMGTAGELVRRFAALGLSVVNVVAVVSLAEIAPAALQQHITWGVLLAALTLYGVGRWSLDCAWLKPRVTRWLTPQASRPLSVN